MKSTLANQVQPQQCIEKCYEGVSAMGGLGVAYGGILYWFALMPIIEKKLFRITGNNKEKNLLLPIGFLF